MKNCIKAKHLLQGETLLAVVNNGTNYLYNSKGIIALYNLLADNQALLNNASVADKIVGKAAALLMVLGKVEDVFADTISAGAVKVFQANRIKYSFRILTDTIKNRLGTGLCPMEQAVINIDDPKLAFEAVGSTLKKLASK